jgi:hypothetical protein
VRKPHEDDDEQRFWEHAETLLERPGVTRSTMMGLPCLRLDGAFFASFDRRTGDLLVKLPATRVDALVASGAAHSFAPTGRRFREWAAIDPVAEPTWPDLIEEAFVYVAVLQPSAPKRKRTR